MRSVNSRIAAAAAAVSLAACGNYSTEDVRFLAALPKKADLRVAVPAADAAGGLATAAACGTGTADAWLGAKPASDDLNATVELLLGMVDVVRGLDPSFREADARGWGPFPDERHPGREVRVGLVRTHPDGPDAPPRWIYGFDARVVGSEAWTTVLAGQFTGASASRGAGALVLDFDALWALGMADATAPHGRMFVQYDRSVAPVVISVALDQDGLGLEAFGYRYEGRPDGGGAFDYAYRNGAGALFFVHAAFDAAGRGRSAVAFQGPAGNGAGYEQCWDAEACLLWVNDPLDLSCEVGPCSQGAESSCPALP